MMIGTRLYQLYCNVTRENESFHIAFNHLCAPIHNIVGVTVATAIFTMHKKAYVDLHIF